MGSIHAAIWDMYDDLGNAISMHNIDIYFYHDTTEVRNRARFLSYWEYPGEYIYHDIDSGIISMSWKSLLWSRFWLTIEIFHFIAEWYAALYIVYNDYKKLQFFHFSSNYSPVSCGNAITKVYFVPYKSLNSLFFSVLWSILLIFNMVWHSSF